MLLFLDFRHKIYVSPENRKTGFSTTEPLKKIILITPIVESVLEHGKKKVTKKPVEKDWICDECGASMKSRRSLTAHKFIAHNSNTYGYSCEICGFRTMGRDKLLDHVSAVHHNIARHRCRNCNKAFKYERNLRQHYKNGVCLR